MPVGVLDVGSNTIRLLVARVEHGEIVPVDKDKVRLPLGEEIELFGAVSDVHVASAAKAVRKLAKLARSHSVESLDVFLTAPGRQSANAGELVAALTRAAGAPVRVLSTDEEGRLATAVQWQRRRSSCRAASRCATSAARRRRSRSARRTHAPTGWSRSTSARFG